MKLNARGVDAGQAWAYVGLTLGGVASVAGNVAHAYIRPDGEPSTWRPELGLIFSAAFWPLALLIAVEVLARTTWTDNRWGAATRYLAVGSLALFAAVVSYQHMSSLLRYYEETRTAIVIGPLGVDGLMVVCSLSIIAGRSKAPTASVETPTESTPDQPARATETPAPAASPDPAESTPIPPRVSSAGSDAKPDPIAAKAAGSSPPRSGVSATGADPIGAGGTNPTPTVAPTPTAPTGGQSAPDSANESGSSVRAIPADWTRPKGSDPTLISALVYAVDEEWLTRPLSETDVTALVVAGGKRARELRDQANASLARRDLERANITEHHEPTGVGSHD